MAEWVVFRLSALGDAALMTGVLAHAHEHERHTFTVITREALAPLFAHHPAVTNVVTLPQRLAPAETLRHFRELARRFAGTPLLDWHATLRSRLLGLLWRGPVHRYPKAGFARRLFLHTRTFDIPAFSRQARELARRPVPQRYAATLYPASVLPSARDLVPRLYLTAAEREIAHNRLAALRQPGVPLIALHPYATHTNKAWPEQLWLRLMSLLHARGWPFFVVGRLPDNAPPRSLPAFPVVDFTNQTDLRATCALLAEADHVVTGDSGPLHLACGVGTPVVALFGPTTAHWGFFPQGAHDHVLHLPYACRPCSLHGQGHCPHQQRCLRDLEPELVMEVLARGPIGSPAASSPLERCP